MASELAFLMGEVNRVTGMQQEVMRKLEEQDGDDTEDDLHSDGSFERDAEEFLSPEALRQLRGTSGFDEDDEDGNMRDEQDDDADFTTAGDETRGMDTSNIHPSIRSEILDEFDNVIEENEFIDAELLEALLERLWSVTTENEKQQLISQLSNLDSTSFLGTEQASEVGAFERMQMTTTMQGLEADCAQDVARVENAIGFINRKVHELCETELPFTVFNVHLLGRIEEVVGEAIKMHRLNLLMDSALNDAFHGLVLRFERMPVLENIGLIVGDISDLLYDEMLFANLYTKQNEQFEDISTRLRRETRLIEARMERLQTAQSSHRRVLMRDRQNRLRKNDISMDVSFGDMLDPLNLDVDSVIAQSPGGQFASSANTSTSFSGRYSPTARRGLIDYEQLLAESTPAKHSDSVSKVNQSLIDNFAPFE